MGIGSMARNTRVFLCSSELSPTCFDFKVLLILQHPMTPLKRSKAILYSDRLRSLVDQPRLFSLVQFSSFNSNFLNPPQQSDAMCEMCFFCCLSWLPYKSCKIFAKFEAISRSSTSLTCLAFEPAPGVPSSAKAAFNSTMAGLVP